MPKRIPTPPPADDEPRYLTVNYPYPLCANIEHENDRLAFIYWMASCIGKENLYALFHKPKSPNMVIIEVNRLYTGFNTLLGEHRWADFLRRPTPEEKNMMSKVFYCQYSSGREVEKYGWKRIFVMDEFFKDTQGRPTWLPINDVIVHPYPKTYRCEVPPEDKTREPLCRPLPVSVFPVPKPPAPPARMPTVGTPEWSQAKALEAQAAKVARDAKASASARAKGPPASPWTIVSTRFTESKVSPGVTDKKAWARLPKGMVVPPALASSSSDGYQTPPGLEPPAGNASASSSEYACGAPWEVPDVSQRNNVVIVGDDDDDDDIYALDQGEWSVPVVTHVERKTDTPPPAPVVENLWADYDTAKPKAHKWYCPVHAERCPRGVCEEYAVHKREEDRKSREEERSVNGNSGNWRSNTGGRKASSNGRRKGRDASSSQPATVDVPPRPAHLTKGPSPNPRTSSKGASPSPRFVPPLEPEESVDSEAESESAVSDSEEINVPAPKSAAQKPAWLSKGKGKSSAPSAVPMPKPAFLTSSQKAADAGTAASPVAPSAKDSAPAPPSWLKKSTAGGSAGNGAQGKPASKAESNGGWDAVSEGPWKTGASVPKNARSVAASSVGGWDAVSEGPWKTGASVPKDARSVAASSVGGWGSVSEGPWKTDDKKAVTRAKSKGAASNVAPRAAPDWDAASEGPWKSVPANTNSKTEATGPWKTGGTSAGSRAPSSCGGDENMSVASPAVAAPASSDDHMKTAAPSAKGNKKRGKGKGKAGAGANTKGKGKEQVLTESKQPMSWADQVEEEEATAASADPWSLDWKGTR